MVIAPQYRWCVVCAGGGGESLETEPHVEQLRGSGHMCACAQLLALAHLWQKMLVP